MDKESKELIETKLNKFLQNTKNTWSLSDKGQIAVSAAMSMLSTKHGFYANIPIICKMDNCPYGKTCQLLKNDLAPYGEPCPLEIAKIMKLYNDYTESLNIREDDEVDQTLLRDLIKYEIILDRCDAKMSQDADFMQMVPFLVTENGDIVEKPEIHKALELHDKISKKKNEILQLFNSTRKDKAEQKINVNFTPTQMIEEIMQKAKEFDKVVEIEYEVKEN